MNLPIEKFKAIEKEITDERGDVSLFAIFLREDSDDWDVVVAAPWLGENKKSDLDYLVKKIKEHFDLQEMLLLSRIILVNPSDESVKAINDAFKVEHEITEIEDRTFFGMPMEHAYIITSNQDAALNTYAS
jgi:hypothetical protein